jgi:hypothetical protein
MVEFIRMCDFFGWDRNDERREEARRLLKDAIIQQFTSLHGTDVDNISSWKNLCRPGVLDIVPNPDELEACQDVSD